MIFSIRGKVLLKNYDSSSVVIETAEGIGYEIYLTPSSLRALVAEDNKETVLYISESSSLYGSGGATTLYGFESTIDREIFELLRSMPSTGAKKSLEYLEKIKRSPSDFKNAILSRDTALLATMFGFRKPTAEKFIANIRDKIMEIDFSSSPEKMKPSAEGVSKSAIPAPDGGTAKSYTRSPEVTAEVFSEALAVLVALGYRESAARMAIDEALTAIMNHASGNKNSVNSNKIDAQMLVRAALKKI